MAVVSRRRQHLPPPGSFPPQLAEFDVNDWWVTDPEDPIEVQYARIRWGVARRDYLAGEDWESHLQPPAWMSGER